MYRVGTDCSGMDSAMVALKRLKLDIEQVCFAVMCILQP